MNNVKFQSARKHQRGFTLLELLLATIVFLIVAGAALSLFRTEQPLLNRQQNYAGLNISMRNAVAQIQLDMENAGTGYYPGTNISDSPVGITIVNQNPTAPCNNSTTFTYSSTCFDTLNIISMDPNTPAVHPDNGTFTPAPTGDCIATTSSPIYLIPPTGVTAAALASDYHNGDELLLVNFTTTETTSGATSTSQMTTILLSGMTGSGGSATTFTSGTNTAVKLTFNATNADGSNSVANDPLGITTSSANPKLATSFCSSASSTPAWVMRLAPVTYWVDTTTPSDPTLKRTQNGVDSVLAEQVIGFKAGAVTWGGTDDTATYSYNAATDYNNQWWLIRSVQVAVISRTTPHPDATFTYRNAFDGGPYQVESEIATINPRNLSMNNN